jgi:hypothetical protein
MWREAKLLKEPELEKWFDVFRDIRAEEIIAGYNNSKKLIEEFVNLAPSISRDRNTDIEELVVSAQGLPILNALFLVIKKYDLGQTAVELLEEPKAIAEQLEYWLYDYSRVWRIRNKESELYRIRENVTYLCDFLRRV